MHNFDDLPQFEPFHRRRRPSFRKRRAEFPACVHKYAYRSAGKAEQARARQLAAGTPYLRVYHCPDCRSWHLTHKS